MLEDVFATFAGMLRTRFERGVHTTEDSIRYTFFAALLTQPNIKPHEVVQEFPHPQIPGAEIDTFMPAYEGKTVAIEFKYDRAIPSGAAIPRPLNAGELFKDIWRLSQLKAAAEAERLLVYCTDPIMTRYFRNPSTGHVEFFEMSQCQRIVIDASYMLGKPATFLKALGADLTLELECRWAESLPKDHELRIYSVNPPAPSPAPVVTV